MEVRQVLSKQGKKNQMFGMGNSSLSQAFPQKNSKVEVVGESYGILTERNQAREEA